MGAGRVRRLTGFKFIPENLVIGGGSGEGNGLVNGLFGIALLEKLSGRSFAAAAPAASEAKDRAGAQS